MSEWERVAGGGKINVVLMLMALMDECKEKFKEVQCPLHKWTCLW